MPDESTKPEQTTEAYDKWVAEQAAKNDVSNETKDDSSDVETPVSTGGDSLTRDEVKQLIQEARDEERAKYAATQPLSTIPNHGAGVGVDSPAETWSQYDQELAFQGEHPDQQ